METINKTINNPHQRSRPAPTQPLLHARTPRSVHGLNADQVLVSDYFGLESSRAPSMLQKIRDLNLRALQGDNYASLELLGLLASGLEAEDEEQKKKPAKKKTSI